MLRSILRTVPALVVACLLLAASGRASAQVVVAEYYPAPPVVGYYSPPVVYPVIPAAYYVPSVSYYTAPTLSYYSAPGLSYSYYAAPVVGYSPAVISRTRYGLFGYPRVTRSYYGGVYLP
jgi:hypothetical protein